jgi:ecotin
MIKKIFISAVVIFVSYSISAQEKDTTKLKTEMFPTPKEGFQQFIIQLEPKEDEDAFKVEIYGGITAEIDCNKHQLSGTFTKQNLEGWGYNYFEFNSNGTLISTRMFCPEDSKHREFVLSNSELLRYNSKLPIVIYVPNGIEVRYKIWERDVKELKAVSTNILE